MSFFKKKLWLVFVLILAVTVIFAALSRMGKNPLSDAVNTVLTPIQSSVAKITQSLDNGFEYLSEMKGYKQKNEELVREIRELTAQVKDKINGVIGIHCHNDTNMADANSVAAVREGATIVQATINGIGERCGNCNLCTIIPSLQIKLGYECIDRESLR